MDKITKTKEALVLRTDFSNEELWKIVCEEIEAPEPEEGFQAYVTFLSDPQYKDISADKVITLIDPEEHWFVFVVDKVTLNNSEHPILCIDFQEKLGNMFRLIPSQMWGVENNLSICNMEFSDFADNVDSDGIFRDFK